jgi:hypothetical protein
VGFFGSNTPNNLNHSTNYDPIKYAQNSNLKYIGSVSNTEGNGLGSDSNLIPSTPQSTSYLNRTQPFSQSYQKSPNFQRKNSPLNQKFYITTPGNNNS